MAFEQKSLDDYVEVSERVADFRKKHPEGTLQAYEPWKFVMVQGFEKNGDVAQQTFICYTAAAYRTPDDPRPGIGVAWEIFPGRTPYTRGSELQNAETSAWGRAIIAVGASDSKRGIASREEVRNRQAERDVAVQCPFCKDDYVHMDEHFAADLKGCGSKYRALPLSDRELLFLPRNKDGSVSRSRTSDEQKAAAGVMTDPQQRAHNQLAKPPPNTSPVVRIAPAGSVPANRVVGRGIDETGQLVDAVVDAPVDDPWYDSPAPLADLTNPEDRHGTATADQIRSIQATFVAKGFKTRDDKIAWLRLMFGPDVHSSKDLSYTQAAQALQELTQ